MIKSKKRISLWLIFALVFPLLTFMPQEVKANVNLSGAWQLTATTRKEVPTQNLIIQFSQTGNELKGRVIVYNINHYIYGNESWEFDLFGTVSGDEFFLKSDRTDTADTFKARIRIKGDKLEYTGIVGESEMHPGIFERATSDTDVKKDREEIIEKVKKINEGDSSGGKTIEIATPDSPTGGFDGKWEWKDGAHGVLLDITVSGTKATIKYSPVHNGAVQDTITFNGKISNNQIIFDTPEGQITIELENKDTLRYSTMTDSIFFTRVGKSSGGQQQPKPQPTQGGTPAANKATQVPVTGGVAKESTMVFNGVTGVTTSFKSTGAIGYRLYRSETQGELGISVTDFYITSTDFTDVNVESNTTYYYTLKEVLAEAKPLEDIREQEGKILATWTVTTATISSEGLADPTATRHFIMLKLEDPKMSVDGVQKEVDPGRGTAPIVVKGRTMVPIRAIVESMDGTAGWEAGKREVSLAANGSSVIMWLDKKEFKKDGADAKLDVPPFVNNQRTFVPIRFSAENLKCQVDWINSTKSIVIVWSD